MNHFVHSEVCLSEELDEGLDVLVVLLHLLLFLDLPHFECATVLLQNLTRIVSVQIIAQFLVNIVSTAGKNTELFAVNEVFELGNLTDESLKKGASQLKNRFVIFGAHKKVHLPLGDALD